MNKVRKSGKATNGDCGEHYTVKSSLQDLENAIPRTLKSLLNSSAAEHQWKSFKKQFQTSVPDSFVAFHSWRDGALRDQIGLMPEFNFLRLSSVLTEFSQVKMLKDSHLVPLFSNGAGDFICLSTNETTTSPLYLLLQYEPDQCIQVFDSGVACVKSLEKAWSLKVFNVQNVRNQTGVGGPSVPVIEFSSNRSRHIWNDIVKMHNPAAISQTNGISVLNTHFLLSHHESPGTDIFNENEYLGFAETFPNQIVEKHWKEFAKQGRVVTAASQKQRSAEINWLEDSISMLEGIMAKRRGSDRLNAQLSFLKQLKKAALRSREK